MKTLFLLLSVKESNLIQIIKEDLPETPHKKKRPRFQRQIHDGQKQNMLFVYFEIYFKLVFDLKN